MTNVPLWDRADGCSDLSDNDSCRCAECEGTGGGSGDDGIGGRRIRDYVTYPTSIDPTLRHRGRRGGGLAFLLAYVIWVVSAFMTFSDFDPCGREEKRAERRRKNRMRRALSRDRKRRRATVTAKKTVWVAVAPPPWLAAGDCAGSGHSLEGAGLSALQGSMGIGEWTDAYRRSCVAAVLSVVAPAARGPRTA